MLRPNPRALVRAVFAARSLPGLKVVAAPAAGIECMPWRSFLFWHTLTAIVFTLGFGLAAFVAGAASSCCCAAGERARTRPNALA